jgi:hypothetical protein
MTLDWRVLAGIAVVAAIAGWLLVRHTAPSDVDFDEIDRDLATLTEALQYDQRIESALLPPRSAAVELPSSLPYRRAIQFWQPAFAAASKERP